jgi:glycerol-3-phosphate acyltransferase PlsX
LADTLRIAIDVMGGDHGLRVSLPAALASLQQFPHLHVALVGAADAIRRELDSAPDLGARISVVTAEQVVDMSEKPSAALRHKVRSSMRVALDLLAAKEVAAVVSAGNTGALMAMGAFALERLPGIDRPAICAAVPTRDGCCWLLDLGANVDCSPEQLHQFALMGAALAALDGAAPARVALLNIGAETSKGNTQVKAAAELLRADEQLNYVGFVEGDSLFRGGVDVAVCDGFVGNVALKVCEGTASLIADKLRAVLSASAPARLLALLARPTLRRLYAELDPQRYNGACLLGLQGIVVKSHGGSTAQGFERAIARAVSAVEQNLLGAIAQRLAARSR